MSSEEIVFPIELDDDFGSKECALDAKWMEFAKLAVNDDPSTNSSKIETLRSAILEAGIDLKPGDDNQLLGMLRAGSGDVKAALEIVRHFVDYQNSSKKVGQTDLMRKFFTTNKDRLMVLPHRDKHGRRVIAYQMWDAAKFDYKEAMAAFIHPILMLSREPKTQIAGVTLVGDMTGMSRSHIPTSWAEVQSWATFMKGGAPVWFHSLHVINAPWIFEMAFNFAKPFLNEKAKKNMRIYKKGADLSQLYEELDRSILPDCLGGEAGAIDNSKAIDAMAKLEDYFLTVQDSHVKE